jgi:hypothetical protein
MELQAEQQDAEITLLLIVTEDVTQMHLNHHHLHQHATAKLKQSKDVEQEQPADLQDAEITLLHNVKQTVEEHLHLNLNQETIVIVELKQ